MPTKDQVERLTQKLYNEYRQAGKDVSKETIRAELIKRAQRIENKKQK